MTQPIMARSPTDVGCRRGSFRVWQLLGRGVAAAVGASVPESRGLMLVAVAEMMGWGYYRGKHFAIPRTR